MNHLNLIFGGAGFIGSNLADLLGAQGHRVLIVDNFINAYRNSESGSDRIFSTIQLDLSETRDAIDALKPVLRQESEIKLWHLAANSDIRIGQESIGVDLKNTFNTTLTAIETIKEFAVSEFIFASSSAVYGDFQGLPFSEDDNDFKPESNYGYMKLLSEYAILARKHAYKNTSIRIFRFPNVVGSKMTHGVIFDLYKKIQINSREIEVLGNGFQKKPFIHVSDLIGAMLYLNKVDSKFEIYNIGPMDTGIEVREIVELMINKIQPDCIAKFGHNLGGWEGDIPRYSFNIEKSKSAGLKVDFTSKDAVIRALETLNLED